MGKIIFNIIFNYIDKLVENDFEQMKILFEMFTLQIKKFPNILVEK